MSPHDQLLSKYSYNRDKPSLTKGNMTQWHGTMVQSKLAVTIRRVVSPHIELLKYLTKVKAVKSENVLRIFEISLESNILIFVSEYCPYGTLANALQHCHRLDDADAVHVSKLILNGWIDLLKADCSWFGNEEDIEFGEGGLKLGWNNGVGYSVVNPIGAIVKRITLRENQSIIAIPETKLIAEIVQLSKENASEIALSSIMKNKPKVSKRKGKNWFGLREYRNKSQYFDQVVYFAVSLEYGFIKVKQYESGKISQNILAFNKNPLYQQYFTKVIDSYTDEKQTFILSYYSNDGTLQSYLKKLKQSSIKLSQQQIQFIFYSLIEPLKQVQQSSTRSLNMLHLQNIYLQNSVPKIGEPVPVSQQTIAILKDRSTVPDFYHSEFKANPFSHDPRYDTYSLGVLLYKLMYTEYPIFPNASLHIPTTPVYNPRLKAILTLFLNQGGILRDLQTKIQISQTVLKQIQTNRKVIKITKTHRRQKQEAYQSQEQEKEEIQKIHQVQEEQEEQNACCTICCNKLKLSPASPIQQSQSINYLEQSPYRSGRIWVKIFLISLFYVFAFYYAFLRNIVQLLADQNLLQPIDVLTDLGTCSIITTNYLSFLETFPTTTTYQALQSANCLVSNCIASPNYNATLHTDSFDYLFYLLYSLLVFCAVVLLKVFSVLVMDNVRAVYNRQHGINHFNVVNYILLYWNWQCLLAHHFFVSNFIFHAQTTPCVGAVYPYASTTALFTGGGTLYYALLGAHTLFFVAHLLTLHIACTANKLINPVTVFGVGILILGCVHRLGFIGGSSYYPAAANDNGVISGYFLQNNWWGIIGVLPEILLVLELAIYYLIDGIFLSAKYRTHNKLANQSLENIEEE